MPCFKVECPNYRIACDIDTCPRYLTNIRVDVEPNGELVGQGFCNERGTRYFSKVPQEKITSDAALTKQDLIPDDVPGTGDETTQNKAQFNAPDLSSIAKEVVTEIRKQPLDARLVDVAPSAAKGLRTAMKDPGGRPKKTKGGAKVMTQAEMATAFGSPCNEAMVSNWEARAAGKKRGANPPDVLYNGERIIYSAELRLNPTPDNQNRLSALITEFQSRHRIKEAIGKKALHMKSSEALAKASGQVAAAIREQSQLKYEK